MKDLLELIVVPNAVPSLCLNLSADRDIARQQNYRILGLWITNMVNQRAECGTMPATSEYAPTMARQHRLA